MADMDPRTGRLDSLTIICSCGYSVTWTRATILKRCGADMRPFDLVRGLRCTSCGVKGKAQISGGRY